MSTYTVELPPRHLVMSGAQDVLEAAGTAINLGLVDLIRSLAFSIVPPTAVYMDLWIIMASFKQTNLQKMSK